MTASNLRRQRFRLGDRFPGGRIGNCKFIAGEPRNQFALAGNLLHAGGDQSKHAIAYVITVPIVDSLEAVELDRQNDELPPVHFGLKSKILSLVGKALAIQQARHAVRRGDQRGARLSLLAHFRFMLKVDIAAPAEQDERDVQCHGDQQDLEAGPQPVAGKA